MNDKFITYVQRQDFHHPEVHKLMSHIFNAQALWNARIRQQATPFGVWDLHEWPKMPMINEQEYNGSLMIIDNKELDHEVVYTNSFGETFTKTIEHILLHVANHGTHHRSQMALLIRQTGQAPPKSDYIYWN